jgi:hypothetical protein
MQNKVIKIKNTSINKGDSWTRIDIISEEAGRDIKYSFFTTKKDGSATKAFEFFKEHKSSWDDALMVGESVMVEVGYDESEYSFVGKDGKSRTATRRTIKAFKQEPAINQPIGDQNQAEYRIKEAVIDIDDDLPDEINIKDIFI